MKLYKQEHVHIYKPGHQLQILNTLNPAGAETGIFWNIWVTDITVNALAPYVVGRTPSAVAMTMQGQLVLGFHGNNSLSVEKSLGRADCEANAWTNDEPYHRGIYMSQCVWIVTKYKVLHVPGTELRYVKYMICL